MDFLFESDTDDEVSWCDMFFLAVIPPWVVQVNDNNQLMRSFVLHPNYPSPGSEWLRGVAEVREARGGLWKGSGGHPSRAVSKGIIPPK